jgi:hypothetical protein
VHSIVRHGEITEQHLVSPAAAVYVPPPSPSGTVVAVVTTGPVPAAASDYARRRMEHLAEALGLNVLFARVKLGLSTDPAVERPASAQATLDVDGTVVRAHVAAHEMSEAVDLLERRLRGKVEHEREHREATRQLLHLRREPGEWRHGMEPDHRPPYFDRPPEERELVRHKSFTADVLTPDEAAFEMEQLDYDFHLYTDLASGEDCVIERTPAGYRLRTANPPKVDPTSATTDHFVLDPGPAPVLSARDAIERLDVGEEPYVFFVDRRTGRGSVLYHRYDGHYGLVTLDAS